LKDLVGQERFAKEISCTVTFERYFILFKERLSRIINCSVNSKIRLLLFLTVKHNFERWSVLLILPMGINC